MKYISEIGNLQFLMKNYVQRLNAGKINRTDSSQIINKAGESFEMIKIYQAQEAAAGKNTAMLDGILNKIETFIDAIIRLDIPGINASYEDYSKTADIMHKEQQKADLISQIFQTDVQEMNLHSLKLKLMQDTVNMDLQLYGTVTEMTAEIVTAQHCQIIDNQVTDNQIKENPSPKEHDEIKERDETKAENYTEFQHKAAKHIDRSCQGYAYRQKSEPGENPKSVYGKNPEDILSTLREWNEDRPEDKKYRTCYIRTLNPQTNKYENSVRYDVPSGRDITPIYLTLPSMKRDEFLSVVAELKRNGARYNPEKKAFYVTSQNDLTKFTDYLPAEHKPPGKSVLTKLQHNSEKLETENKSDINIKDEAKITYNNIR